MTKISWWALPFLKSEAATSLRYLIVGASGQFCDYVLTLAVYSLISNLTVSNITGYVTASLYTYILHTTFTFGGSFIEIKRTERILNFVTACMVGAIVSTAMLILLVHMGLLLSMAKIAQLLIAAALQYLYNRLITFRGV